MTAPRGWSKARAAREGRPWRPADREQRGCYYCGVVGCDDCGDPPALLRDSGVIPPPIPDPLPDPADYPDM